MTSRLKGNFAVSKSFLWWWILACLILMALYSLAVLWMGGKPETQDAFNSGRRVLVALDDGKIEGKPLYSANEIKPEPEPTEAAPAEAPPEAMPAEAPPVSEEPPKEEEKVVEALPVEEPIVPPEPEIVEDTGDSPTIVPSANPLPDTNDKLIEKAEVGLLPMIGADGTKPWRYYSKSFEQKGKQPMIAVVISGLGQKKRVTERALALPENFTLSFSPYSKNVENWAETARLTAHERMIDLPMEPSNYPATDPGPHGLLIANGLKENETRLQWLMARFTGAVGFLTPQNEVFTGNTEAFRVILQSLANRGLLVVVGREVAKSDVKDMLETSSTANIEADILIDEEFSAGAIETRLAALEQLARKNGSAVGIAQSTPLTIEQLQKWHDTLAEKGIVLVPLSAVAKLRFS